MNYLILAMKRSGQHAIMKWIQSHTKQDIYNNVCFGWENKKLLTMVGKKEAKKGIANIEDFNPSDWDTYNFSSFDFVENVTVILIIRTASNWLASCYKRKFQKREDWKDVYKYLDKPYTSDGKRENPSRIDIYCNQLGFVSSPIVQVTITFDDWVEHENYRKMIAKRLGFKWSKEADDSRFLVTSNGGGSSFDGMKYNLEAPRMNLFRRSSEFDNDGEFEELKKTFFKKAMKVKFVKDGVNEMENYKTKL